MERLFLTFGVWWYPNKSQTTAHVCDVSCRIHIHQVWLVWWKLHALRLLPWVRALLQYPNIKLHPCLEKLRRRDPAALCLCRNWNPTLRSLNSSSHEWRKYASPTFHPQREVKLPKTWSDPFGVRTVSMWFPIIWCCWNNQRYSTDGFAEFWKLYGRERIRSDLRLDAL